MDKNDRPWLLKFLNHAAELQQQFSKSPLALPNLTEVSMYQEWEDGGIRTSEATALLQLDSVKTFSASNCWLYDDGLGWSGVRKPQFSATSLEISIAYDSERTLPHQRNFYSRFPLLERFHYDEGLWSISPSLVSDLMQGLSGVTSTLLDFSLWMDNSDCVEWREVEKFSIGSLANSKN
ncbi:hypothetical protein HYALB_00007244 [Hymenoscyphus albidus]|uniref:Uncharacterized protein n=1 Tax=Hymenoscyphus albidus TaxID=595503 RepID=A0A9N9Q1V1_9HELO|nr:hypothetical protein HYALB_00007244 [Hymenoscyphus albidus]